MTEIFNGKDILITLGVTPMNTTAISVAYVTTGAFYVARDFAQPIYNRPGYVRERRLFLMAILVVLWFPWTLRVFVGYWRHVGSRGIKKYFLREAWLLYSIFGALSYVLALVLS